MNEYGCYPYFIDEETKNYFFKPATFYKATT